MRSSKPEGVKLDKVSWSLSTKPKPRRSEDVIRSLQSGPMTDYKQRSFTLSAASRVL